MKLNSRFALPVLVIVASLCFAPSQSAAQSAQSSPQNIPAPGAAKSTKPLKFDGQVIAATSATITVRSRENAMLTQTFSYSPAVRTQMVKILNKGGYQFGDKVDIHYTPGTTVAIKLQGKPSKPRTFTSPNTSQK
jgi:hypothetical protein